MMMTYRKFLLLFSAGVMLLLVAIAGFNRVVDPFWLYQDFQFAGINTVKPKFAGVERHIKPQRLIREQPEAIILGNSFSEIGMSPENIFFTDHDRLKAYNFAFAASDWERTLCYFEFALKHAPISRMVIGIDAAPMPWVDCKGKLPEIETFSEAKMLLSLNALRASMSTLSKQDKEPTHRFDGTFFFNDGKKGTDKRFKHFLTNKNRLKQECHYMDVLNTEPYAAYMQEVLPKPSVIDLEGLEHMMKLADQHNVELIFYVYPAHAHKLEMDIICGTYIYLWQNLAAIATLLDNTSYKSEVWDFVGVNYTTTEEITEEPGKYWQDPMHFNPKLGHFMLEIMIRKSQGFEKFGGKVSMEGLKKRYQIVHQERQTLLQKDHEFLSNLKEVLLLEDKDEEDNNSDDEGSDDIKGEKEP
jgi:hypothetical protein